MTIGMEGQVDNITDESSSSRRCEMQSTATLFAPGVQDNDSQLNKIYQE